MFARILALTCLLSSFASAQAYRPSGEKAPMPAREFRAAWAAVVHNIDWPSKKGLSSGTQQAESTDRPDKGDAKAYKHRGAGRDRPGDRGKDKPGKDKNN